MSDYIGLPDSYDRWLTTEPEYDEPTLGEMLYTAMDDNDPQFDEDTGTFSIYLMDTEITRDLLDKEGKLAEWEAQNCPEGADLNFYAVVYRTEEGLTVRLEVTVKGDTAEDYNELCKAINDCCEVTDAFPSSEYKVELTPEEIEGLYEGVMRFVQESEELCEQFNEFFGTKLVSLEKQAEEYEEYVSLPDEELQRMADEEFERRADILKSDIVETIKDCELHTSDGSLIVQDDWLSCGGNMSLEYIIGEQNKETGRMELPTECVTAILQAYRNSDKGSDFCKKAEALFERCGYTEMLEVMRKENGDKAQTLDKSDVPVKQNLSQKEQEEEYEDYFTPSQEEMQRTIDDADEEMQRIADEEYDRAISTIRDNIVDYLNDCYMTGDMLFLRANSDFRKFNNVMSDIDEHFTFALMEMKDEKAQMLDSVKDTVMKAYNESDNAEFKKKVECLFRHCGTEMQKAQTISKTDVPVEKTDIKKGQVQE